MNQYFTYKFYQEIIVDIILFGSLALLVIGYILITINDKIKRRWRK